MRSGGRKKSKSDTRTSLILRIGEQGRVAPRIFMPSGWNQEWGRPLLRHLSGWLCIGVMLVAGGAYGQTLPRFEVVSIKSSKADGVSRSWHSDSNTNTIKNYSVLDLMLRAYHLKTELQVLNAPDWVRTRRFDIVTKVLPEEYRRLKALTKQESEREAEQLLESMLMDRFGLQVQRETRAVPIFAMVKGAVPGKGLTVTPTGPDGRPVGGEDMSEHDGHIEVSGVSMNDVSEMLSGEYEVGRRIVVNRTEMPGYYAFKLDYAPDHGDGVSADATLPGLVDALQDALGVKLVKDKGEAPVVIVTAVTLPEFD